MEPSTEKPTVDQQLNNYQNSMKHKGSLARRVLRHNDFFFALLLDPENAGDMFLRSNG
jgi:hypothetical protein